MLQKWMLTNRQISNSPCPFKTWESHSPPETSLTMSAPFITASRATGDFHVSIESNTASGARVRVQQEKEHWEEKHTFVKDQSKFSKPYSGRDRIARIIGIMRANSSSWAMRVAPGFVDSPPMSIMSHPSHVLDSRQIIKKERIKRQKNKKEGGRKLWEKAIANPHPQKSPLAPKLHLMLVSHLKLCI